MKMNAQYANVALYDWMLVAYPFIRTCRIDNNYFLNITILYTKSIFLCFEKKKRFIKIYV